MRSLKKVWLNKVPKYIYRCEACGEHFEKIHSMSEKLTDCECGKEDSLVRVPSLPFCVGQKKQKTGQIVKDFIEDTRREVEAQKQEMTRGMKDD